MNKVWKGALKIVVNHLIACAVALFCMIIFAFESRTATLIVGGIIVYLYALIIYSGGWRFGQLDSRLASDATREENRRKGIDSPFLHGEHSRIRLKRVVIAAIIAMLPAAILLGLRIVGPAIFGGEYFQFILPGIAEEAEWLGGAVPITYVGLIDLIYRIWVFPVITFFGSSERVSVAYFLAAFIVPVFTILGYLVGRTRFSISAKLLPWIEYKKRAE